MIQLAKRARRRVTPVAKIRKWETSCRRWAVEEIKSRYRLPTRYLVVERLENGNERIASRHRKRRAAEKALCRIAARRSILTREPSTNHEPERNDRHAMSNQHASRSRQPTDAV